MTTPEDLVRKAEAAYMSLDIDRMMALFDPDVVQYFNGKKRIEGRDALRQDHLDGFLRTLPDGTPGIQDYRLMKTLRMACGDMMGVEFASSFVDRRTGQFVDEHGAEFWRIKGDRLIEWHAYATERSRLEVVSAVSSTD
jgi:uncharacterized protein (TIGR02246 family)